MKGLRYLPGVSTLVLDEEACIGCSMCWMVCPHTVFGQRNGRAVIADLDGCMECGACATNCPVAAITVTPGVGCAAYIIQKWLKNAGFAAKKGCC
jgi:ferredoxin